MNARQRREDFLACWDPVRILPLYIDAAAAQLREAGLPATIGELRARERKPGTTATRSVYDRIRNTRSLSTTLRDYAEMVWHGDALLRQCQKRSNRELLAQAVCFFVNHHAAFAVDSLPLRKAAQKLRGGAAKGNTTRQAAAARRTALIRETYLRLRKRHPRRLHGAICTLVTAELTRNPDGAPLRGFGESTVRAAVADWGPRRRKK